MVWKDVSMLKKLIPAAALLMFLFMMMASGTRIYASTPPVPVKPAYQDNSVCSNAPAGFAHCLALHVKPTNQPGVFTAYKSAMTPAGFSPADLRSAYGLPNGGAKGRTVAIVDAYN